MSERPPPYSALRALDRSGRHLDRLERLYAAMDRSYQNTADRYGFQCHGCDDNCCRTLFHHHTHVEFLYLLTGFRRLERQRRRVIVEKARAVCRAARSTATGGALLRRMCPLNFDDRCCLYAHRPMICRMHGVPSELRRPDGHLVRSPGCPSFMASCGQKAYVRFDRTPFYQELAGIEQELRQEMSLTGKLKMTVAEMILAFESRL